MFGAWLSGFFLIALYAVSAFASDEPRFKVNWLAISDRQELERTWDNALVYLPAMLGGVHGKFLDEGQLSRIIEGSVVVKKYPLILFLHYCEGTGHHREDMKRLSRLGFIVIAPDSFAREHRPLGCYEDREKYIRYFDAAIAFQKAELDYAVEKLAKFDWIDRKNMFLFGSGTGGLVVAHYEGDEFSGHLIEGWGCRGPNPIFDGIWAPEGVRVFSTVSRNTPFLLKNEGFSVDCESFIAERPESVSVVLDRPAHQVSWYPGSYKAMIRFLMRDMGVEIEPLLIDEPEVISQSDSGIKLREKWSDTAVYDAAKAHCSDLGKKSWPTGETIGGVYSFVCE